MFRTVGTLFFRILEGAHPLELCPTDELLKLLEILFGFSRESHHERRTDMYSGHFGAHFLYQPHGLLLSSVAMHPAEHMVGNVLQGDVEIFAYIWLLPHHVEQFHRELVGIGIVQAYPSYTLDVGHPANQLRYMTMAVQVYAIIGQFLGDDLELLHAVSN